MQNDWIEINEDRSNLPQTEGPYLVRYHTGSMSPKIVERVSFLNNAGPHNRWKFQGEIDWSYATHWKNIENI